MTDQSWPSFDEDLRIRLQKEEEPRADDKKHKAKVKKVSNSAVTADKLANRYTHLTKCVYESIKKIVPEKRWIKKNGRVVSKETKALFEARTKEFQKETPAKGRRKRWNKRIRNECRRDYRTWVTRWVEKIENADGKGDTKAIYRGETAEERKNDRS